MLVLGAIIGVIVFGIVLGVAIQYAATKKSEAIIRGYPFLGLALIIFSVAMPIVVGKDLIDPGPTSHTAIHTAMNPTNLGVAIASTIGFLLGYYFALRYLWAKNKGNGCLSRWQSVAAPSVNSSLKKMSRITHTAIIAIALVVPLLGVWTIFYSISGDRPETASTGFGHHTSEGRYDVGWYRVHDEVVCVQFVKDPNSRIQNIISKGTFAGNSIDLEKARLSLRLPGEEWKRISSNANVFQYIDGNFKKARLPLELNAVMKYCRKKRDAYNIADFKEFLKKERNNFTLTDVKKFLFLQGE